MPGRCVSIILENISEVARKRFDEARSYPARETLDV